jgi:cell division protein YceG involved in septum cleavage
MRRFRDLALFLLVILSVFIIVICLTFNYYLLPVSKNTTSKMITIKDGNNINKNIDMLVEKKLIRNPKVFKIYLTIYKIKKFETGTFTLKQSMSSKEIADILSYKKIEESE